MMRLSEYSLLLEKVSARLKKLRAGNATARPGMAAPRRGGTRVIRIPHDDRYLINKTNNIHTNWVKKPTVGSWGYESILSWTTKQGQSQHTDFCFVVSTNVIEQFVWKDKILNLFCNTKNSRTCSIYHDQQKARCSFASNTCKSRIQATSCNINL